MKKEEKLLFVRRPKLDEDYEDPHKAKPFKELIPDSVWKVLSSKEHEPTDLRVLVNGVEAKIMKLSSQFESLKNRITPVVITSRGDTVYENMKEQLESQYMGRIVAIDLDSQQVVGDGDSIQEAYEKARRKMPEKDQFYFRLVGKTYLERF